MDPRDVPEESARAVRCPTCAARRGYPCQSQSITRASRNRAKKRACMGRRRAWLARNENSATSEDHCD